MAQRDNKEETELRLPETLTLCANNCGFYGNPATNNMCLTCFKASASAAAAAAASASSSSAPLAAAADVVAIPSPPPPYSGVDKPRSDLARPAKGAAAAAAAAPRRVSRCAACRRRVGLTGFRCRCGELFCGEHRYSDRHGCAFDYKAAAREAIARENPVVRAPKIVMF